MNKYEPISQSLSSSGKDVILLSFSEIEKIMNDSLPASARKYRAWWSNDKSTHTQANAWLEAGYKAERVDMNEETIIFRRKYIVNQQNNGASNISKEKIHINPLFGCMKGTITIADDVDLTEPADPNWAELIDKKHPKA